MLDLRQCSCGVALESSLGKAYNEEAFRYFLAVEQKRTEVSLGCSLLVLVNAKEKSVIDGRLSPGMAAKIFTAMWRSFREIDYIGWFRQGRVAGAVLILGADSLLPSVVHLIDHRITLALREQVPSNMCLSLRVRVLQLHPAHASGK
jgi:hypothetical protein